MFLRPSLLRSLKPASRKFSTSALTMSASSSSVWAQELPKPIDELNTYLCVLPDFTEGSKRLEIRQQHLEGTTPGHKVGWIVKAGPTFADDSKSKMTGSYFLMREVSVEAARARLSQDIYATGGAWDMSKATIQACGMSKH
ncbi:hypothetical protein MNV49_001823 [Pseudohyphozyma bogoriensis]|nr:hypothetical protein MNV49_001823 [Pseudohyphozyma bogoriensis]